MSVSVQMTNNVAIAGISITGNVTRTGETPVGLDTTLPPSRQGTLSTRTDADTGIVTVLAGHGITTDDTVALFWTGGYRYGMAVTAVTGTTVSVDLGSGDDLPVQTTALILAKEKVADLPDIDGNTIQLVALAATFAAHIVLEFDDGSLPILMPAAELSSWAMNNGFQLGNPFDGKIIESAILANASTSANRVRGGFLIDSIAVLP
jgi:hypothetical protein